MDQTLLAYPHVFAAANQPNAVFEVMPGLLRDKTGARVIQVTD